jgi:integrase
MAEFAWAALYLSGKWVVAASAAVGNGVSPPSARDRSSSRFPKPVVHPTPNSLHAVVSSFGYARQRRRRHPLPSSNAFFLTERGTAVTYPWVARTFRTIRAQLGWRGRPAPRIHDLRHTFAVRNLLRWCRAGQNVDSRIALLSKYLGHVNVTGTYWYLTAVPELMALTSVRFERWAALPGEE